jgi:RecA/RadA recombinase
MAVSPLMKKLLAASPTKHAAVMSESVFFNDKDVIPIEYPILNIAFSGSIDGGMSNALTVLAGQSGVYKTLTALICVKAYLNKYDDAVCILLDSEGGITPAYLRSNGIDPERVLHVPIEHLEMLKFELVRQLKEINRGDHVIFMIDSIGNTGSLKEVEDAQNEKSVVEMGRAKVIKGLLRIITPSLVAKDVPCICIAHTYDEIGSMYPKTIISGGQGIKFSANQAFIFTKSQEKTGTDLVGYNFTITVDKSRFVREKSKLTFQVLFDGGIQKYSGLLDLAIELGFCQKPSQGWYSRVYDDGVVESRKWRAKDTNCAEFWDMLLNSQKFKKAVEDRFKLGGGNHMTLDEDDTTMATESIGDDDLIG